MRLAELSHVDRISISRYETGKKKPSVDNLKRLAVALGVSTDELLRESA
jgi:transcriptional regulator with XRE-family HTH domain